MNTQDKIVRKLDNLSEEQQELVLDYLRTLQVEGQKAYSPKKIKIDIDPGDDPLSGRVNPAQFNRYGYKKRPTRPKAVQSERRLKVVFLDQQN